MGCEVMHLIVFEVGEILAVPIADTPFVFFSHVKTPLVRPTEPFVLDFIVYGVENDNASLFDNTLFPILFGK